MVQYADYAGLLTNLSTIEEVLDDHNLGHDFIPYRNHVYRVLVAGCGLSSSALQLTID